MSVIRGKIIRNVEFVPMSTTYGDWPFVRDEQGRWVCRDSGKLAKVQSLKEWLSKRALKELDKIAEGK